MSESLSLIDPRRNEISGTSTFTTSLLSPLSLLTTIGVLVPTLLGGIFFLHALTDRLYPATLFSLHMTVELLFGCFQIQNVSKHSQTLSRDATVMFFFFSILDIYLCGWTYPPILNMLENSFVDIDDTILSEWRTFWILLWWLKLGIHLVVMLRLILLSCWMVATISRKSSKWTRNYASRQCLVMFRLQRNWFQQRVLWKQRSYCRSMSTLRKLLVVMTLCSFPLLFLCFRSCSLYLWSQTPEKKSSLDGNYCGFCDDLDDTECALPFPSFHHMRRDASSRTGWRVNLQPTSLPRMKGDQLTELSFLNDLDGFSPMAPILFYIQGLKESQQAQSHGMKSKVYPTLPYAFEDSINNRSATILWDVKTHTLIPHTARVDLLDPEKPIILVFPSKPLNHATHYALAVIDATDAKGRLLSPTAGMQKLLSKNDDDSSTGACSSADIHRRERYLQVLLPSLKQTASWLTARHANHTAPLSPQLLFDFITMSHDSLQPARDIRDATLERVSSRDYEHRVQITKLENENCRHNKTLVARAIHGSISVPWWLTSHDRDAILSKDAMYNADKKYTHPIKFVMYVPCSLYAAATNQTYRKQRPLRAILEYGHGMFYNRAEANDYSLQRFVLRETCCSI